MATIPYEGSLVDDINLVNQEEKKDITNGGKTIIFILITDVILSGIITSLGVTVPISAGILAFCNAWMLSAARKIEKKVTEFNQSRRNAMNNIRTLINTLSKTNENSNNLVATVDYDNIKKAVVVSEKGQEDISEDLKEYEELMNDYIEVVTSYIYYLDSENKINILREVNKTYVNYDYNYLVKVKGSRKPNSTKVSTLELLEDKVKEKNLPVKIVLELK